MSGFLHESTGHCVEWCTPPEILDALGPFDLDPCAAIAQANGDLWATAKQMYTVREDGLTQPWYGRVWLNPPYDRNIGQWLMRMVEHGNGILLIYARTDTRHFFEYVWPVAHAILFVKGRIKFYNAATGIWGPAGAPSVLVAYGMYNVQRLRSCNIPGMLVERVQHRGRYVWLGEDAGLHV